MSEAIPNTFVFVLYILFVGGGAALAVSVLAPSTSNRFQLIVTGMLAAGASAVLIASQ